MEAKLSAAARRLRSGIFIGQWSGSGAAELRHGMRDFREGFAMEGPFRERFVGTNGEGSVSGTGKIEGKMQTDLLEGGHLRPGDAALLPRPGLHSDQPAHGCD